MNGPLFDQDREHAWESWHAKVILGSDISAVSHEAFCAGWEAEREHIYAELGNDHYVIFTADRWTVEHSVECRLSGQMPECAYHVAAASIADEPRPEMLGRWRISEIDSEGLPALERADAS